MATPRATTTPSANADDAPAKGRLRWRRIVPAAILLLGIAVWLAPAILARTSLRHRVPGFLFPAYTGTATIDSAGLGWNSPVILRDVACFDAQGRQWLTIPEVNSSKTLFSLLFGDSPNLGVFTLVEPTLSAQLRHDGSDFEDRLAEILADDGSSGEPTAITVKIQQGAASWIDPAGNEIPGGLENLDAAIHQAADALWPAPVAISATVTDGEHDGSLQIQIDEPASDSSTDSLHASLTAKNLPLAPINPWLRRFGMELSATGTLSSDLKVSASPITLFPVSVHGDIEGQRLRITPPSSAAPILIEHAALQGKATHDGRRIVFENVSVQSEAARLALDGVLDPAVLTTSADWKQRLHDILEQDLELTGSVDLARLPTVVSLPAPAGKSIESGRLRFTLKAEGDDGVRRGVANITTSDLVAGLPDRQVTWKEPFSLNIVLKQDETGLSAENLRINSDFLTLDGSVAGGVGHVKFNVDLDQLREHLSQFVPTDEKALAGRAAGECRVQQEDDPGLFKVTANAQLTNFALTWAGGRWSERDFRGECAALVRLDNQRVEEIQSATVTLKGVQGDEITLTLLDDKPQTADSTWPFQITAQGQIARWMTRLRTWSLLPPDFGWTADGTLDASARVLHGESGTKIEDLKGSIETFQASNGTITIAEPKLSFTGDAAYDQAKNTISSTNLRVECDSLGIQTQTLVVPLAAAEPLRFEGTVRGSLSELARYAVPRGLGIWPSGVVAGPVKLLLADTSNFNIQLKIEKPVVNRRVVARQETTWRPIWSDDSAILQLTGRYTSANDALTLEKAHWQSQGVTIDTSGTIQEVATRAVAALQGRVTYDWATLRSRIPALSSSDVTITGRETRKFSIQGPLVSPAAILDPTLQANASLGWQKLILWGIPLDQGRIAAKLQNSRLTLATSRIPVAGGSAQIAGDIAVAVPLTMAFTKGRVANNVQLTPETCRTWLSYATPLLADVADVQGAMSLDLSEAAVPLLNPAGTRARAVLSIQSVNAQPGPTARAILQTVQQIQQIAGRDPTQGADLRMTAPAQKIQLTVANGRVHHDRFLVRLGGGDGPMIQTSGSVGFDESLNLVAEIPLEGDWFRDERIAALLGGQTLRIPITGTLAQPIPDPRALQEFSRRAAAGAVKNILQQQLGDDPLKKLLGN